MAKWIVNAYDTIADAETAIELIDNTVAIHVFGFKDGVHQKIVLVQAT